MIQKGRFKIDVYNCVVHIRYADKEENLLRSINYFLRRDKEDILSISPYAYAYSPREDHKNYYLFFSKPHLTIEYLNHEKSHVIDFILQDREIDASDEVRSYLDGFISHKLNLFFSKRKLKIKNER